ALGNLKYSATRTPHSEINPQSAIRNPHCRMARMRALRLLVSVAAASAAACGPTVDLTKGLQVTVVNTGWYDVGIVNGQNKLVPAVSFTLKNVSERTLVSLQVNALFRRVSENDEWGSELVIAAGSSGLA